MPQLRPPYREIQEELPNLIQLSTGLWPDPDTSDRMTIESMAAVLMQNLTGPRLLEKLTAALLIRAQREGSKAAAERVSDPFYRMSPEERLLLIGLHRGKWSYERLSKILETTPEKIQEFAWAARLHLVYSPESAQRLATSSGGYGKLVPQALIHPTGTLFNGQKCPGYHPGRPWTQRYLDSETRGEEKHFLQTHLTDCANCRKALARARTLYYSAEKLLPGLPVGSPEFNERLQVMASAVRQAVLFKHPGDRRFLETVALYFRNRPGAQLLLSAFIVLVIYGLLLP